MIRQIVLWLLRWLETSLDPDLKARLDAFEKKVAAAEQEEKKLQAEINASHVRIAILSQTLSDNNRKTAEIEDAISHAKAEAEKKKAEQDSLSDSSAVRLDL